jgi:hypothetical protein
MSDMTTEASSPSSPLPFSPPARHVEIFGNSSTLYLPDKPSDSDESEHDTREVNSTPTPKSAKHAHNRFSISATILTPDSLCAKCGGSLSTSRTAGQFVTVPDANTTGPPKTYHPECFRCVMCDGPFKVSGIGQAVFARGEGGACHVEVSLTRSLIYPSYRLNSCSAPLLKGLRLEPLLFQVQSHLRSLFFPRLLHRQNHVGASNGRRHQAPQRPSLEPQWHPLPVPTHHLVWKDHHPGRLYLQYQQRPLVSAALQHAPHVPNPSLRWRWV